MCGARRKIVMRKEYIKSIITRKMVGLVLCLLILKFKKIKRSFGCESKSKKIFIIAFSDVVHV